MIENTTKSFDIVTEKGIENVLAKQLTLKEREKLFLHFEENIKNRRRKEWLELAKLMEGKEKTKYLVECSNSNKVTIEEIIEESQTVNGITEIFKISVNRQLEWSNILSNEDMILPVLKCFYYSLGVEIPDVELEDENTKLDEIKGMTDGQGDGPTQGVTFPG